ncbi:MAG TPA: hypothetical protein VGI93_11155 [Steroidobacteraceae bacterium]|jgi:hypothetical protein
MVSPPDAAKPASVAGQTAQAVPTRTEQRASPGSPVPIAAADRADIRPLDVTGALQILISEVRAELDAALLSMGAESPPESGARPENPQAAVLSLLESVLPAYLQDPQDLAAFSRAVPSLDSARQTGTLRALDLVASWKEVPAAAVEAVKQAVAGAGNLLDEDTVTPLWLLAEWASLAPKLERYRRRRRRLRRWLTDPDFKSAPLDEEQPPR